MAADDAVDSEAKDELAKYLALPQQPMSTCPLTWWREQKEEDAYPNLEVMARQYLGCPASSASVERLFSRVGVAFSDKRKSAGSATLESIMFAKENI